MQNFTITETVELVKRVFSFRNQDLLEPELFESIRGSPGLERFTEVALRNRFNQIRTEGSLPFFIQGLADEIKTWYNETYLDNDDWTEDQEVYLLEEIFRHRNFFGTAELWTSLRLGNVAGPLRDFSKTRMKKCFKRLKQTKRIDQLSARLAGDVQVFYANMLLAPPETVASSLRTRTGWSAADDQRLIDCMSAYAQPRFRFFTQHQQFPGKSASNIRARYIDLLMDGRFTGKVGKSANHHRPMKNGGRRKAKDRFTDEETIEIKKLHKQFSEELQNEAPWVYIWLASEKLVSSRTTADIKDKFRVICGYRKGGYHALKVYCESNNYMWIPPPTAKKGST